jgi:hypothetical protein
MPDGTQELDLLLRQVAEARALVRVARVRLQAARLRAEGLPAGGERGRALQRRRFQRLVLSDDGAGREGGWRA